MTTILEDQITEMLIERVSLCHVLAENFINNKKNQGKNMKQLLWENKRKPYNWNSFFFRNILKRKQHKNSISVFLSWSNLANCKNKTIRREIQIN